MNPDVQTADFLNLCVCLVVFIVNLVFGVFLYRGYRKIQGQVGAAYMLIPKVMRFWIYAWGAWCLLYLVKLFVDPGAAMAGMNKDIFLLVLADLNCICLFVVAVGLAKGEAVCAGYRMAGITVVIVVAAMDVIYLLIGRAIAPGDPNGVFLQQFSMALSMVALGSVGLGFRLRYRTNTVLVWAITYALMLPLVYGVAFPHPTQRTASIDIPHASYPETEMGISNLDSDLRKYVADVRWGRRPSGADPRPDYVAGANTRPTELGPLDASVPPGIVRFYVKNSLDGSFLSSEQVSLILKAFGHRLGRMKRVVHYLQLEFAVVVFVTLAMLKLLLASSVFPYLKAKPQSMRDTIRMLTKPGHPEPVSLGPLAEMEAQSEGTTNIVEHWKGFQYIFVLPLAGLLTFVFIEFGIDMGIIELFVLLVTSLGLFLCRGGRSLVDFWGGDGGSDAGVKGGGDGGGPAGATPAP